MSATRIERDPLGELAVPADALYGIQTERARRNFPISHLAPLAPLVDAVVWIKKAAALTHKQTKRLEAKLADAIVQAADEVLAGAHREQFVVDPYQAGAGTSHNMNCNEVLANRANELLGGRRGEYQPVHPNDHVNMAQSTNDVIPTAIRLAALARLPALLEAAGRLAQALLAKGDAFDAVVKSGRTHLGDATAFSGALRTYAVDLGKIASDVRLLASGPRTGLAEIILPAVQPGSSIMPGKVNPSIAEMVNMVCYQAIGNDVTVATAAEAGQLELNVMMPVIAHNLLFTMQILTNASRIFADACVAGVAADAAQCAHWLERSPAIVTALAPRIGYARAAELAKEAVAKQVTVRQLVREKGLLTDEEMDAVLDLRAMTEPGVPGERRR